MNRSTARIGFGLPGGSEGPKSPSCDAKDPEDCDRQTAMTKLALQSMRKERAVGSLCRGENSCRPRTRSACADGETLAYDGALL
jgi:hypothetical protein